MSAPAPERATPSDAAGVTQPPAGSPTRAAAEPPDPAAEPGDSQWPSQCEQITGITYRYRKGITEVWERLRLARMSRPRPDRDSGA